MWTWRREAVDEGAAVLGRLSLRDAHIFNRAENFCHVALGHLPLLRMGQGKVRIDNDDSSPLDDEEEEAMLQAAIAASLEPPMTDTSTPEENLGDGRTTAKATSSEAGLKTPASTHRGKKSRGGRRK